MEPMATLQALLECYICNIAMASAFVPDIQAATLKDTGQLHAALRQLRQRARPVWCWLHHILAARKTRPGNSQLLHLVD